VSREVYLKTTWNSLLTFSSEHRNAFPKEQVAEGWESHCYRPSYTFPTKANKLQIVPLGDLRSRDLAAPEKEGAAQKGQRHLRTPQQSTAGPRPPWESGRRHESRAGAASSPPAPLGQRQRRTSPRRREEEPTETQHPSSRLLPFRCCRFVCSEEKIQEWIFQSITSPRKGTGSQQCF